MVNCRDGRGVVGGWQFGDAAGGVVAGRIQGVGGVHCKALRSTHRVDLRLDSTRRNFVDRVAADKGIALAIDGDGEWLIHNRVQEVLIVARSVRIEFVKCYVTRCFIDDIKIPQTVDCSRIPIGVGARVGDHIRTLDALHSIVGGHGLCFVEQVKHARAVNANRPPVRCMGKWNQCGHTGLGYADNETGIAGGQ